MISLQETLRTELKTAVPEQARRAEILRAVLDDDSVWKALDSDDFDAALNLARRNI
jgi:siroheme synthase (precorrin-2 oxidase/ferrochelatase)